MSQENQATNSVTSGSLPVKRKRGRPRKDDHSIQGTPGSDTVKRNRSRKIELAPVVTNAMVGQVVSGVLDGKFDAGYLLTVRVGDSNTILRGVVFEPGLSAPVSGANDVAPHIKMLKRNENPHPVVVPLQTQMHGSNHQSQQQQTVKPSQRNVDPIPLNMPSPVNQVPRPAIHVLSSQLQTKPIALAEVRNDTNHFPQAASQTLQLGGVRDKTSCNSFDGGRLAELNEVIQVPCKATESQMENKKPSDISTKVEAGHLSKGVLCNNDQTPLNPPEQIAQSGLEIEPAVAAQSSQTSPLEHSGAVIPTEVIQENETVSLSECLEDVGDASMDTKLEPNTDSSVEILLPNKTIDQVSQAGSEVVKSEDKPDRQNDKDQEVEPTLKSEDKPDRQNDKDQEVEPTLKSEDKPDRQNDKDQEVEPTHIIVTVAPEAMVSSPIKMLQEVPPTQKCNPLSDTEFKFEMLQDVPPTQKCDPLSDTEFKFEMLQEVTPTQKCDPLSDAEFKFEMLQEVTPTQKCDPLSETEFKFEMLQEVTPTQKCDPLSDTEFKFEMLQEVPSTLKSDPLSDTEFKFEMLQEVPSTLKCDPLSDTELKFSIEIPKTDEASHSNETHTIGAVKVTESDPQPEPGTNQEVEMLQVEAVPAKPTESEDEQGTLSRDMPESLTHESTSPLPESLTHESTFPTKLDDYFPQDALESRTLESTLPTKVDAPESRTGESTEDDCASQDTASLLQSLTNPGDSNSYTNFL